MTPASGLSGLVTAAAFVSAAVALAVTRTPRVALPVLLDLLLAAGLLRLTASTTWRALLTTALIVVVRKLAMTGLTADRTSRAGLPAAARRWLARPAPGTLDRLRVHRHG